MAIVPSDLLTYSLRSSSQGEQITRILAAALLAVDPGEAVRRFIQREGNTLTVGQKIYRVDQFQHIYLIGAGKACAPMAQAVIDILGNNLSGGILIIKEGYTGGFQAANCQIFEASHPIPDLRGVNATTSVLKLLEGVKEKDLVICLISGGGSALLTSPSEGISLQDIQNLTTELLACGATIHEINTLRKHLDTVKGGGLSLKAAPAALITLILSDVIGDPIDRIASGPTCPDPSTFLDAYSVLERYQLAARVPWTVVDHLQRGMQGQIPETPKPGDPIFSQVQNLIIGNNYLAAHAALQQADREKYHSLILTTYLQGEASAVGPMLAAIAQQIHQTGEPLPRPACLILGGETTVTIRGKGLGGRNQEMALSAVVPLAGLRDIYLITLASDGGDGPTDAAGAVVTGNTLARANLAGNDPQIYLEQNDSYRFFAALDDLLKPGPTMTNVNDLAFILAP